MTQGMIFIRDLTKQHFCHSTDFDEELTLRLRCVSTWHHSWRSGSKIQSIMKCSCSLPPWWRNVAFHINRFTEVHCLSTVLWNYSQLVSPPLHLLRWLQSRVQSYPGIPPEADGGLEGEFLKKEWHLSGYARLYPKAVSTFSSLHRWAQWGLGRKGPSQHSWRRQEAGQE